VTTLHQVRHGVVGFKTKRGRGDPSCFGGFGSMSEPVDDRDENAFREGGHDVVIARFALSRECTSGYCPLDRDRRVADCWFHIHGFHFRIVTVVPSAAVETISKSSINLLAPGKPNPRLFPVE
jgi:hypothetical protein